jgi:predicted DNA binding CopG/RHH family protein
MKKKRREILDYDETETTSLINRSKKISLKDLKLKLPPAPPTQVISIRLPTPMVNELRAQASAQDIPYQALIKTLLARSLRKRASI